MRVINKNLFVWPVDTSIKSLQTTLFSDLWFPTNWCFPPQSRYVVVILPRFGDMRTWRHWDERGVESPQVNWWLLKISVNPYKMRPAPRGPRVDNYLRQKSPEILIIAGIWVWPHHREQSTGERGRGPLTGDNWYLKMSLVFCAIQRSESCWES